MRELPRQLTADELADLFEGRTALVERLAEVENPLVRAEEVIATMTEAEKLEALAAHPAIGARRGLSARSAAEQGAGDAPEVLAELAELNRRYEDRFGFRFVVFVDRRPKAEIVPVLRKRLERSRDDELETALSELVAIARDRWQRG
ncbi:MAG TPA: 2-oxo-4-hydroxy-4-carboxy-5-ureidoimidazoline decarboxylase [Gaiellaceae bacterium]|nr:2-oxo-4-hydroxy-4-carboxy-5-ureidoimidazoline decarboxylase [Gaiellaceae bacterium]